MARIYVSIGSNIDREKNVVSCLKALQTRYGGLIISTTYESKAVGFEGDNFYNLVTGFDTDDDVYAVANELREIEARLGRDRNNTHLLSRTLDIDLLLYDDLILTEKSMKIPRDDLTKYAFVLKPLAEIAPDYKHPVLKKTVMELWKGLERNSDKLWPVNLGKP